MKKAATARPKSRRAAPPPVAAPAAASRFAGISRNPLAYGLASLAVLVPCFWQSRLQAGDLSSHTYNAWLAQLIGMGQAPGLGMAPQHTNVLFDLLLSALFRSFGAAAAQRIAVSVCVLVFFWGAFASVAAAARRSWALAPIFTLTAAAMVVIPNSILIPGYNHQLAYVAERMSLPLGVLICAMLASLPVRLVHTAALGAVAMVFFGFLYADESRLNEFEDQVDRVVMQLPAWQRVVLSVGDSGLQVNALTHMIDRACIGRCWSYANYEPASAQFRIRVIGKTGIVADTDADANGLQNGAYVVKPNDLPMYQILLDTAGQLVVRMPPVGQPLRMTAWKGL